MRIQTKTTTIRVPADIYERAKAKAQAEYLSFNQLVCRLIDAYVNDGADKEDSRQEAKKQ